MNAADTSVKVLQLTHEVERLNRQISGMRLLHLRFILAVTVAAGGSFRLSKKDFANCLGRALHTAMDPATGDQLFEARDQREEGVLQ